MNTCRMNGSQERAVSPASSSPSAPCASRSRAGLPTARPVRTSARSPCARSRCAQEDDAAAVLAAAAAGCGPCGRVLVEGVRHLQQYAAPSPVLTSLPQRPMVEVLHTWIACSRIRCDLWPLCWHETDAAGVVLELRVVEALLAGAGGRRLRLLVIGGPACRSRMRRSGAQRRPGSVTGPRLLRATGSWKRYPYDMRSCRRQCSATRRRSGRPIAGKIVDCVAIR